MIEVCRKKEGLLLNLPTIFDNGIYFLVNNSCRPIKPKKPYYELLHVSFATLNFAPQPPERFLLTEYHFLHRRYGIVFQDQLIGYNKDRLFISHHLAKHKFCPFQSRLNPALSPQIPPSLCQCTNRLALFKFITFTENFIYYHPAIALPSTYYSKRLAPE